MPWSLCTTSLVELLKAALDRCNLLARLALKFAPSPLPGHILPACVPGTFCLDLFSAPRGRRMLHRCSAAHPQKERAACPAGFQGARAPGWRQVRAAAPGSAAGCWELFSAPVLKADTRSARWRRLGARAATLSAGAGPASRAPLKLTPPRPNSSSLPARLPHVSLPLSL